MEIWTIYLIKNILNNKIYVGETTNIEERFKTHCRPSSKCIKLRNAIQKYGKENFTIKKLATAYTREQADQLENAFIEFFNSVKNGYNIREGGIGGKQPNYICKKISEKLKGIKKSKEHCENMSKGRKGKPHPCKGKLSLEIAKEIRKEKKDNKKITQTQLAIKYGVCRTTIGYVLNNKKWREE